MKLLTKSIEARLRKNAIASRDSEDDLNHAPVVKFFNPVGSATWLFSELDADGDSLFGLCDLGMGFPELGYASLAEIISYRGALSLGIERDRNWKADKSLTEYAAIASEVGRIIA